MPSESVTVPPPVQARIADPLEDARATPWSPQRRDLVGETLGGTFRVLRRLDEGGMGVVYLAEHVRLARPVAVKIMSDRLAADSNALGRFQQEAETVSRLAHPHVVSILDFDRTRDGRPFIAMELLQGESLAARLQREKLLAVPEAIRIAAQIASGLAAAHQVTIVHRDLKPGNVFLVAAVGEAPFVKLLDFGISRSARDSGGFTREGDLVGTPFYMAPEQVAGEVGQIDHRADQFALAAITYEMLTGYTPFDAANLVAVLHRVVADEPAPVTRHAPWVPAAMHRVLLRALAKKADERFPDVSAFASALAEAARGAPSVVPAGARAMRRERLESVTRRMRPTATPPDPEAQIAAAAADASESLAKGDAESLDRAVDAAEQGIAAAGRGGPDGIEALKRAVPLFDRAFRARVGRTDRPLRVAPGADTATLTPHEAFVISRLDPPLAADDLFEVAGVPRPQAVRLLARLLRRGVVEPLRS